MSLITHDAAASLTTAELPGLLKRWMTLQDEIGTLNAEVKQRRTASAALKNMIMRIMETNNLGQLNVSKGAVVRSTREVKETLSQDYIRKHCKEFFGGDDDKANALIQYLNEHRSTKVSTSIRLVSSGDTGSQGSK
jgi:hypothetical protein